MRTKNLALCLPLGIPLFYLMSCGTFSDITPGTLSSDVDSAEAGHKIEELARLGVEHDKLRALAGTWNLKFKHRSRPNDPWQEDSGTAICKTVLGGRYLLEELDCTYGGVPYKGVRVHGFDNLEGTYFNIWMDTLGTWPVLSRGTVDDAGVLRYHGRWKDHETPAGRPFKTVAKRDGDNKWNLTFFDTIDGEEVKVLEAIYTRRN